jgi:hypothetical protein
MHDEMYMVVWRDVRCIDTVMHLGESSYIY